MDHQYGDQEIATYANPDNWEIWPAPEAHAEVLYQSYPEFTCLCPRSSYPDFATVHWIMIPDRQVVELKHLKLWLNSYRQKRISHELATAEILDTLVAKLDLNYFFIVMEYTPRGNLTTFPMVEYLSPRLQDNPSPALVLARDNAQLAKSELIKGIIRRRID